MISRLVSFAAFAVTSALLMLLGFVVDIEGLYREQRAMLTLPLFALVASAYLTFIGVGVRRRAP